MKFSFLLFVFFLSASYHSNAEIVEFRINAEEFANQQIKLACTLFSDTIDIDNQGLGEYRTKLHNDMFVYVNVLGREDQPIKYLLFQPGKQLVLTVDNGQITFIGEAGGVNELYYLCLNFMESNASRIRSLVFSNKSGDKVFKKLSAYEESFKEFYDTQLESNEFSESDQHLVLSNYLAEFLWKKQLCISYRTEKQIEKGDLESKLLSYRLLKDSSLILSNSIPYKNFLINHYHYTASRHNLYENNSASTFPQIGFDFFMKSSLYGESQKEYLTYVHLAYCFTTFGVTNESITILDKFNKAFPNSHNLSHLLNLQEEYDQLSRGSMAPDFSLVSVDGDTVWLGDFKGKAVFIDVWATWCGPCKKGLPTIKEFEVKYQDVKFVYVSIDTDKTKWEDYIEKNISGEITHLSGDNESFKSLYRIVSIPRYILVDAKGNVVNAFIGNIKSDIENELERVSSVGK